GARVVDVAVAKKLAPARADIGNRGQQTIRQFALQTEVPLLRVARDLVLGNRPDSQAPAGHGFGRRVGEVNRLREDEAVQEAGGSEQHRLVGRVRRLKQLLLRDLAGGSVVENAVTAPGHGAGLPPERVSEAE